MIHQSFLNPLGKALRFYAGIALTVLLFQLVGLLMYTNSVWPGVRDSMSTGVTLFIVLAIVLLLGRSGFWVRIYWFGAKAISILRREGESKDLANSLAPVLMTLTRLLVVSCILDLFFVPVIFLIDKLLPFPVSGQWLGAVYLSIIFLPQAFGIGALILAFLTRQYAQLLKERSQMKEEIELTI
jgi:hypothetical protein